MFLVQGAVSRCKLQNSDKGRHRWDGRIVVSMHTGWGGFSSEGHAHPAKFLSEPKQSCFAHTDRQYSV